VSRFILRFNGSGEAPAEDLHRIRACNHCTVVDASARMLLVDMPDEELGAVIKALPQWSIDREHFVPVPDTRPKLRKSV
jgi:hypothetical protein